MIRTSAGRCLILYLMVLYVILVCGKLTDFLIVNLVEMTPISHSTLACKKKEIKRKGMLTFKTAIRLTNSLIRKFREIKLIDNDDQCLPPKKRKLTEDLKHVDSTVNPIFDCFTLDWSADFGGERKDVITHNISVAKPASLVLTNSNGKATKKRLNLFKKKPRIRIKSSLKISVSRELRHEATLQELLDLFHNCVNVIQPTGCSAIEDIDRVVRSFSCFGKVLSIQDHWKRPRGFPNECLSVWVGATVTYRRQESCHRLLKALSVADTSLIGVSVIDHLLRIHQLESGWTRQSGGTRIVVDGTGGRELRSRFVKEFGRYGTVSDVRWLEGKNAAEVTYRSAVNAVAAALAMDGRCVLRCQLKARIKMTEKELYIHRKLRETF